MFEIVLYLKGGHIINVTVSGYSIKCDERGRLIDFEVTNSKPTLHHLNIKDVSAITVAELKDSST